MGYQRYGICGEVYLWGRLVEHELGWRAQFAYPKTLFLPLWISSLLWAKPHSQHRQVVERWNTYEPIR
jgi:hypothetical protein